MAALKVMDNGAYFVVSKEDSPVNYRYEGEDFKIAKDLAWEEYQRRVDAGHTDVRLQLIKTTVTNLA